jgi:Transposase DDE domain
MLVRELAVHVEEKGFQVNELVLATTMVDDQEYSKEELADLFLERWNIELDLRSIKIAMEVDVLRCKTAQMLVKAIWTHLLAYNLIRSLIAAAAHGKELWRLSFKGAQYRNLGGF